MQPIDEQWIACFLHFGFVPRIPDDLLSEEWARPLAPLRGPIDEEELIARGIGALQRACHADADGHHVVPLSGGFDSRVILMALLEQGLRDQLTAVTFGTPGTFDYDLGCKVARTLDVHHETIDLTKVEIGRSELEGAISRGGRWIPVFEAYFNQQVALRFGSGATIWSGYMANSINGSRIPAHAQSWEEALDSLVMRNRFAKSVALTPPGFDPRPLLPSAPLLVDTPLSFYEQLYITFRYLCRYRPTILVPGYDYHTPYTHPAWIDFMLPVPASRRREGRLFKKIVERKYPEAFLLPTKKMVGLSPRSPAWMASLRRLPLRARSFAKRRLPRVVWGTDPRINYIDFERGLREREDLKALVCTSLQELSARRVISWLDIDRLWDEHQRRRASHGDALILLASLELNLKVEEARLGTPAARRVTS